MHSGFGLITKLPWHWSLEDWCTRHFGLQRQLAKDDPTQWAPYEAHRPERYYTVPTALIVQSSVTAHLQRGFVSAVELLRTSTSGFKAILLTDIYNPPAAEACEWPVEQLVPELMWIRHQPSNWLAYAADFVQRAQQFYGAQFVLAPRNYLEAQEALWHLAAVYNVLDPVLAQAQQILQQQSAEPVAPAGHRWGWQSIRPDQDLQRRFTFGHGSAVQAEISTGGRRGLLLAEHRALHPSVQQAAAQAGWSVGVLSLENASGVDARPFLTGTARGLREAVAPCGPALTLGDGSAILPQAEGRISIGAQDHVEIQLNGNGRLRFPEEQAVDVFSRLAQVLAHKPGTGAGDQITPRLAK